VATSRKQQPAPGAQPRVYGYCRVSTDRQADSGLGLDEQRVKIEARCVENGWILDHVYVDAGVSGSTPLAKRPQGARLLAVVRPGDVIVAAKMDRCFRSAFDALGTIESFKKRKISLWLLDLGGDVSGNGISELMMTVLAAVAQFERTLISERIKDAKRTLARSGRHLGGHRPFGFQYGEVTGTGRARDLVQDPAEQAAIGEIIAMRAAGHSLVAIRDEMLARGFELRSKQSIANILTRQSEDASKEAPTPDARPAAMPWQPPAGWVEAVREGGITTIIGAPRPKRAGPA
jgi:putative DNA-invertase from lambdoid prophage Rac